MASIFTFNGIRKDYVFVLSGFSRPAWSPIERDILKTPGTPGGRLLQTNTDVRKITVPIMIRATNVLGMQKMQEDLAAWLVTDQPCELIFDDEPDRTYLAVIDGSFDPEEIIKRGKGELTFVCPMPYKLGLTQTKTLAITNQELKTTFTNSGSVETNPVIDIVVGAQSPFLDVWNGDDYFRLGYPTGVKTKVVKEEDRLIWDEMNNLSTWTAIAANAMIGTYRSTGSMKLKNDGLNVPYAFMPNTYGTGAATEWHGPLMKRDLPAGSGTVNDFRLDVMMTMKSTKYDRMGKTVVMLLDANDKVIVELAMADEYSSHKLTAAQGVIDPGTTATRKVIADELGMSSSAFDNFYGHVSVARRGKEWSFYFAKYREGTQIDDASFVRRWRDDSNSNPMTAAPVAKIVVGCVQYGAITPLDEAYIEDVKFWKINTLNIDETPYIFDIGDKIKIDTERSLVTINGKNAVGIKDIFSRFPKVKGGANEIIVRPSNVGTAQIMYRERYK